MDNYIQQTNKTSTCSSSTPPKEVLRSQPERLVTPDSFVTKATERVKLDVGGHEFTTTKTTLRRVPNSFFEAMFSGRHALFPSEDGSYFIDRDGTHFRHILNFLRTGAVVTLPSGDEARKELAREADFYGLDDLVRSLHSPALDISDFLGEEMLKIRRDENEIRDAFRNGSASSFGLRRSIVSLFSGDDPRVTLPLTYQPVKSDDLLMGNLRKQTKPGKKVIVESLEAFRTNFNHEHPNILGRLQDVLVEEPVIIAGGSVLRALTARIASRGSRTRTSDWWGGKSDIDIFLHCSDTSEANRVAKRIFYALAVDNERWAVVRSGGVINIVGFGPGQWSRSEHKCQIVLRLYESPAEIVLGFDCDCCCCAYDGTDVLVSQRCLVALRTGTNVLNPLHAWPNKSSYELRLAKYAFRGFPVVAPGLDKSRIDTDRIRQSKLQDLKGMARLLKVTYEMDAYPGECDSSWRNYTPVDKPFPVMPNEIPALRHTYLKSSNESDRLVGGMACGYDDMLPVIVPSIYGARPNFLAFLYAEFPFSSDSRAKAWEEIEDAGSEGPERVHRLLLDAWDTTKRSREYLNSDMEKFDLDNLYYGQAYKQEML